MMRGGKNVGKIKMKNKIQIMVGEKFSSLSDCGKRHQHNLSPVRLQYSLRNGHQDCLEFGLLISDCLRQPFLNCLGCSYEIKDASHFFSILFYIQVEQFSDKKVCYLEAGRLSKEFDYEKALTKSLSHSFRCIST